jgi:hypothetical protein
LVKFIDLEENMPVFSKIKHIMLYEEYKHLKTINFPEINSMIENNEKASDPDNVIIAAMQKYKNVQII